MANYATLKSAIQAVIKQNGNNEITGNLLQQSLLAMVNSLGAGYQYAGIATPDTNPGTPDQNVFYIASTPGIYTSFGGEIVYNSQIAIFSYNGTWAKQTIDIDRFGMQLVDPSSLGQGLFKSDGSVGFTSDQRYRYCPVFFRVRPGYKLYTNAMGSGTAVAMIYYDENQTRVSTVQSDDPTFKEYTVPENVSFVRVCQERFNITQSLELYVYYNEPRIETIMEYLSKKLDTSFVAQGLLSASNGQPFYTQYSQYRYCETYFPVTPGQKIYTKIRGTGNACGIAYYDANKAFVSSVAVVDATLRSFVVPDGVSFARFSNEDWNLTNDISVYMATELPSLEYQLIEKLQTYDILKELDVSPLVQGLLRKTTGAPGLTTGDYPNYRYCNTMFGVEPGNILITDAACAGSWVAVAFYDSVGAYVSGVEIDSVQMSVITVPNGCSSVRLCTERYNITNGIRAFIVNNESPYAKIINELLQIQNGNLSEMNTRIDNLEAEIGLVGKPYFNPDRFLWIMGESTKSYNPTGDEIQLKHKGTVTPQNRFVTFGFDDWRGSDFSFIIPLFEKYGMRAEFNRINYVDVAAAAKINMVNLIKGHHEPGDHTFLHYKFPFDEPLFNGQNPASPDGSQTPYPTNAQMRNDVGGGYNIFGHPLTESVKTSMGYQAPDINTAWGSLSDAECQQIREWFSVMKDPDTNIIATFDALSNEFLGTTGNSVGSWDNDQQCYTGGIFTGCKTSANHEIWERVVLATNMYFKNRFGLNFNLKTWSLPGSKASNCYYKNGSLYYYDTSFTKLANNLAKFPSSLYKNQDGTAKMRSWTDVLKEFGYHNTNDSTYPSRVDGQTEPSMSIQYILNARGKRPDALIYANITHRNMHYATIATEYTQGSSLQGSKPLEVQMYDGGGSFRTVVEAWRHGTANGIVVGELIDSQDTWSERVILEGLMKFALAAGIQIIPLEEAFDVCFNNNVCGGNLIFNPTFRNSAAEFMPLATTVPSNPDGYVGDCSVEQESGTPVLKTTGTTVYEHFGIPVGKRVFNADIKGSGTITFKLVLNETDYNNRGSAATIATKTISNADYANETVNLIIPDNAMEAYEQRCAGYGKKAIALRIEYSSGLYVKNIILN